MKAFKHNPHPIDLSDFIFGQKTELGGRDFEQEEPKQDATSQDKLAESNFVRASVNKLRRSVSERLFSMKWGNLSF